MVHLQYTFVTDRTVVGSHSLKTIAFRANSATRLIAWRDGVRRQEAGVGSHALEVGNSRETDESGVQRQPQSSREKPCRA